MPSVPTGPCEILHACGDSEEDFVQAIKELVKIDKNWIPTRKAHHFISGRSLLPPPRFGCKGRPINTSYNHTVVRGTLLSEVWTWLRYGSRILMSGQSKGIREAKTGGNYAAS